MEARVQHNQKFFLKGLMFIIPIIFASSTFSFSQNLDSDLPNILWLVSEDNSPFLGCYGDTFATTPNLDKLASEGILYDNAFANSPVCAPARSTLITGVYTTTLGTENMRSFYRIPEFIRLFPEYLRELGYYTTNNAKTDYNFSPLGEKMEAAWDESSSTATYKNREAGQPFFAVFNTSITHESSLHTKLDTLQHDPEKVSIPPYHPQTSEMKYDWAQYYDKMTEMDEWVGEKLRELEEEGLAENTIIFYFGDHGGVLGRSKRFLFESGLRVPLIIKFPEKYRHLAPLDAGSKEDRLVSFVDFAPSLLNLLGMEVPDYMQGHPFLGDELPSAPKYAYGNRGRMDERVDLSRTIRSKGYRYTINFMPKKIYGQYIEYLWRAPSMRSWEKEFKEGRLDSIQSAFWETKPFEELYDVTKDPDNIDNLANDPKYSEIKEELCRALIDWMVNCKDVGFIPESTILKMSDSRNIYDFVREENYPIETIINTAINSAKIEVSIQNKFIDGLSSSNLIIRFWAAVGLSNFDSINGSTKRSVLLKLNGQERPTLFYLAKFLYNAGEKDLALDILLDGVNDSNMMNRLLAINILEDLNLDRKIIGNAIFQMLQYDYDVRAAKWMIER